MSAVAGNLYASDVSALDIYDPVTTIVLVKDSRSMRADLFSSVLPRLLSRSRRQKSPRVDFGFREEQNVRRSLEVTMTTHDGGHPLLPLHATTYPYDTNINRSVGGKLFPRRGFIFANLRTMMRVTF